MRNSRILDPSLQEVVVPQPRQEDAAAAAEHKMQGDVAFRAGLFEVRRPAVLLPPAVPAMPLNASS